MGDSIILRKATPSDAEAIARIQAESPESAYWSPESYFDYDCLLAVAGSDPGSSIVGFLVSRQVGPGEREILNMAVIPYYRRRGVARTLLKHELKSSRATWFLEVRESNVAARNLYKQLGFIPAGLRERYYQDPPEAAIVMRNISCYCHGAQSAVGDRLPEERYPPSQKD